jgi:twitching motility two-component system response regulator PilH
MSDKPAQPAPAADSAKKEFKVLIIDDDKVTTHLLENKFRVAGYIVSSANSGKDALEKLKADKPDAVVMDVLMPGVGGYQIFTFMKEDETLKGIPVFVMSARKKMEDTFAVSGAEQFFVKPFKIRDMIAKVAARTGGPLPQDPEDQMLSDQSAPAAPAAQPAPVAAAATALESAAQKPAEIPKPAETPKPVEAPKPAAATAPAPAAAKPAAPAPEKTPAKIVVYIAGDRKAPLTQINEILTQQNCQVVLIEDSKDIFNKVKTSHPDLLVMEIILNNPKFPGHEVIRRIRKMPESRKFPIMVYSYFDKENLGNVSFPQRKMNIESARTLCTDAGIDLFLGEFTPEQFLQSVLPFVK